MQKKETIKILDFHVGNLVISKLTETKNNFKFFIGYLDEGNCLHKMSGYVKTFKNKNNTLMSLHINDDQLLEKYKAI